MAKSESIVSLDLPAPIAKPTQSRTSNILMSVKVKTTVVAVSGLRST